MTGGAGPQSRHDLSWLLRGMVEKVPCTRSAVLLSSDGLARAAHGLDRDGADQLAAVASGLFSITRSAGARFSSGGGVRQIVAELDEILLFVCSAGYGSVLIVVAGADADAGLVGYEMLQLVKGVRPFLATPARNGGTAV
jgi:predicted regulator of Ras-like GTPase activity (Roadblock/LC7/MglB family)